jgi:hypothetical protein
VRPLGAFVVPLHVCCRTVIVRASMSGRSPPRLVRAIATVRLADMLAAHRTRMRLTIEPVFAQDERAADRLRSGARVQGRRAVLAQSWRDQPTSHEPRRNLRPRVATRSKWARIEALTRNRAFAAEYTSARRRWRHREPATFPSGTYWLQRFASVQIAQ